MKTNLDTKMMAQIAMEHSGLGDPTCLEMDMKRLLSLAKQQWIEEIGKMKKIPAEESWKDKFKTKDEVLAFNQAISDVLSYLKGGER